MVVIYIFWLLICCCCDIGDSGGLDFCMIVLFRAELVLREISFVSEFFL